MPIFRKEKSVTLARENRLNSLVRRQAKEVNGRIVRPLADRYPIENSSFFKIDKLNRGKISKFINGFLVKFPKRKINVLDWGCGQGVAIKQLVEEKRRVNGIGFSKDAYPAHKKPGNATIVNTSTNAFYRYLKSQKIKFDVVYSHLGLVYASNHAKEIIRVSEFVRVGGVIFPGVGMGIGNPSSKFFRTLEEAGLKPNFFIQEDRLGNKVSICTHLTKIK